MPVKVMHTNKVPTYGMCNLLDDHHSLHDILVYPLREFLSAHQNLLFPHKHSFYQVLYITSGKGSHIIDFEKYDVKDGFLYCLAPGQVHSWHFEDDVDGYLINFNETFLSSFLVNSRYLDNFPFFRGSSKYGVYHVHESDRIRVIGFFENLLAEQSSDERHKLDMMRASLIQLCIYINRKIVNECIPSCNGNNQIVERFEELIEKHFLEYRLPKHYASLLFMTPNHLNAVCKQVSGKSAGEIIRDRVLLEAKRSLVNGNEPISSIAYKLNFEDNSYFTKFFKKYAFVTPEDFRKKYHS